MNNSTYQDAVLQDSSADRRHSSIRVHRELAAKEPIPSSYSRSRRHRKDVDTPVGIKLPRRGEIQRADSEHVRPDDFEERTGEPAISYERFAR